MEPKLILIPSECVKADRDEPEGDERGVDATVRHHTRMLQVLKVPITYQLLPYIIAISYCHKVLPHIMAQNLWQCWQENI